MSSAQPVQHKESSLRRASGLSAHSSSMLSHQTPSLSARRPLRSSPLAGPALSPTNEEEGNAPAKPTRVASSPNIPTVTISPPQHIRISTVPSLPTKRSSFLATQGELPPIIGILRPSTPPGPGSSQLTVPTKAATQAGRDLDKRSLHRTSAHFQPPSSAGALPKTLPTDSSWMTDNTYETTPRFSRLSLSSATVVLPVSAKEHRRQSRPVSSSGLSAQFQAFEREKPTAPSLQKPHRLHSHSMPSLIRSDSRSSSRTSKESLMPATPPTCSLASLIEPVLVVEEVAVDIEGSSSQSSSQISSPSPVEPSTQDPSMTTGWRFLSLKSAKSLKDFNLPTLSFLDTKPSRPQHTRALPKTGKQHEVVEPGHQPDHRRTGTVKRLLRAVSFRKRRS